MVSELARGDFEDLKAAGLSPTLDDFDRLNQLALRLTDGAATTAANFPRIGWAGDVPFYQPTLQAFYWYHQCAAPTAANEDTEDTFWAFALAHAREPGFFAELAAPSEIEKAVVEWAAKVPATREEIIRACRYAVCGFDDARPAENDGAKDSADPRFRADRSAAAENLARVEAQLAEACAALGVPPDSLMRETQSRLSAICEAAAVEAGRKVARDEARLRAAYDLTLREITRRLRAEKAAAKGKGAAE